MGRAGTRWRVLTASGLVALAPHASPAVAQEDPPTPTTRLVTGPIAASVGSHGHPLSSSLQPLEPFGYVEEEVFLEGTATVHGPSGIWRQDGKWGISDITKSPYRTRLLVRRPVDPARFNGTVVVSWLNVGAGFDFDPEWAQMGEELVREGAAFVGVSAQTLGVEGRLGARAWDAQRYEHLVLSGDNLAYDIFTQAGEAIRSPGAVDPLEGLAAERRLLATGQSQSAQRLVTYINAFHPAAQVYDGFLLISRYRGAAPLGNAGVPSSAEIDPDDADAGLQILSDPVDALLSGPPRAEIRSDTDVPVFVVLTETEAVQNATVGRAGLGPLPHLGGGGHQPHQHGHHGDAARQGRARLPRCAARCPRLPAAQQLPFPLRPARRDPLARRVGGGRHRAPEGTAAHPGPRGQAAA